MEKIKATSEKINLFPSNPSELIKSCRVCMAQNSNMSHIFDSASNITDRIEFCTGIQLSNQNGLPTQICDICLSDLYTAHKFKTTCIQTENAFQKILLGNIKIECDSYLDCCNFNTSDDDVKQEIDDTKGFDVKVELKYEDLGSKEDLIPKSTVRKKREKHPFNKLKCAPKRPLKKYKFKKLYCELCEMKFQNRKESDDHRRNKHSENISWICEICGKVFTHRASLYTHTKSHRPPQFGCEHCDYKTWQKHDLSKHIRIHTGVKLYQCEYCTASYYTSSNLTSHIRRFHEQIKRFSCNLCDKKFYDTTKLNRHIDSHNEVRRFQCDVCHSSFTRRCYWKKHLHRQHDIVIPPQRPGKQKINFVIGEDLINAQPADVAK